jgi:16S rRNA (cytosine967-C5)-methyltransferase
VLEQASDRAIAGIDPPLLAPLRVAVYQLLFLDRIPAFAAVDEAVDEIRHRGQVGATGFVNAVLRRVARAPSWDAWPVRGTKIEKLSIETSHPDFLVRRWLGAYGEEKTRQLLAANNEPKRLHLLCLVERGKLAEELESEGVEVQPSRWSPLGLTVLAGDPVSTRSFASGHFYIQDEGSQAAGLVPLPGATERILDAAAAPGGKTFAISAYEPRARVVSSDLSLARLCLLRENQRRTARSLPVILSDARQPALAPVFDRVILDIPCSGTGTLARRPELKWRLSVDEIRRLGRQGLEIMDASSSLVCPGGILCLITCSLESEENDEIVAGFLRRRKEFALVALENRVAAAHRAAVAALGKWQLPTAVDHDGFTVHVLSRSRKPVAF